MGGSLAVWEVVRAPKRFHALFSATWRRYLYLFPLKNGEYCYYFINLYVSLYLNICVFRFFSFPFSFSLFPIFSTHISSNYSPQDPSFSMWMSMFHLSINVFKQYKELSYIITVLLSVKTEEQ